MSFFNKVIYVLFFLLCILYLKYPPFDHHRLRDKFPFDVDHFEYEKVQKKIEFVKKSAVAIQKPNGTIEQFTGYNSPEMAQLRILMQNQQKSEKREKAAKLDKEKSNEKMKKNKKKKFKQVSPSKQIEKNLGRVKAFYDQNGLITRTLNVSQCKTAECICTINNGEFCVPPDRQMQSRYTWSAEHRTVACVIQKSMSTVMSAIMCFLHNKTAFRLKNREFATECYPVRFCAYINEAQTMERMLIKLNQSEEGFQEETVDQWRYLAVIRNPMDRFLSAYVDKCIGQPRQNWSCHECKSNLTCFMERQYEWQMYNAYRNNVTVRGFFEDRHFAPQNWRCNFTHSAGKYDLLPYSSNPEDVLKFLEKLSIILREQGVDQKSIRFIQDQVTRKRTDHSTIESPARKFYEKYLRTNPYLMELLVKMYYHDYVQFGFKLPDLFGYKD